jgi:malate synthase
MGAVPINNLMEDAATAEISRAQLWQWIHHPKGVLSDGRKVTLDLCRQLQEEELAAIKERIGGERFINGRFVQASELLLRLISQDDFEEFLTLPGYQYLD